MYCAYPVTGVTNSSLMYFYNGKTVYAQSPNGEDFRDTSSYPSSKAPSSMFSSSFLMPGRRLLACSLGLLLARSLAVCPTISLSPPPPP
uniref:Transcription factor 12-like n=1 Tax=Callorhinchus milii TaxID=7868 RepID=A0A4W3GVX4_CALMI